MGVGMGACKLELDECVTEKRGVLASGGIAHLDPHWESRV